MRRIRLTPAEQAQLEHPCKATSDRRLRDRCQAVLMASRGRERKAIAQDLGVHRTTVQLWRKQYHQHGLEDLPSQWAPGRLAPHSSHVGTDDPGLGKGGPQGCGLDRAHWTDEALTAYLYQTTGIEVQRTAMRDFCQRHGMRPYRPTYHYLRGDPQQQEARKELAALKKSPSGGVRTAESRRSPLPVGADVTGYPRGEGPSPHRRPMG